MDWKKMMTYGALMYLACEQIVIGVVQLHRKKWARQHMDILCAGVKQLQWKIFALELDISFWKTFVLKLDNS